MRISNAEFDDFLDVLREWIKEQFKFWRTYSAVVEIDIDPLAKGRVAVSCPELLSNDILSYIWAVPVGNPRQFTHPKMGDMGLLIFKDGDPEQARFLSEAPADMVETSPVQLEQTVVETAMTGSSIKVSDIEGFTIESKSPLGLIAPVESSVLGEKLRDVIDGILDDFIADIYAKLIDLSTEMSTHIHTCPPAGPSSPAMPPTPVNAGLMAGEIAASLALIEAAKLKHGIPGQLLSPANKNN